VHLCLFFHGNHGYCGYCQHSAHHYDGPRRYKPAGLVGWFQLSRHSGSLPASVWVHFRDSRSKDVLHRRLAHFYHWQSAMRHGPISRLADLLKSG
jgi:hypothetical protein